MIKTSFSISDLLGKKNVSCDVNVLIGYDDSQDELHTESEQFFKNLSNYENFLFFDIIKMIFINKISHRISQASIIVKTSVISVLNELEKKGQKEIGNKEFEDMVEKKVNDYLNSIKSRESEKIKNEILRITANFTYTSLIDQSIRDRMIERNMNFSKEESSRRLDDIINQFQSKIRVFPVDSYFNDRANSILISSQGFNDSEDLSIAIDIFSFHLDEKIDFEFHSGDEKFVSFLEEICLQHGLGIKLVCI